MIRRQDLHLKRFGLEASGRLDQVDTDVGQLRRHRAERQHLRQLRAALDQVSGTIDEVRVDDERGDPGVVDDVGVVVERAERME